MKTVKISNKQARRIAIKKQLIGRNNIKHKSLVLSTEEVIKKLGYIQIDTIAVIERAHHHTLWTRQPDYLPDILDKLQKERKIFEYWGHAASFLPIDDFRFYLPKMKAFNDPHSKWEKDRYAKYGHLMKPVLDRIKNEGPLCSNNFTSPDKKKGGTWWDWRPTKVALELLFWRGELMVSYRKNFSRYYDLTERVLPSAINTTVPDNNELGRFLVMRALNSYGVASEKEILNHIIYDKKIIKNALDNMLESNELVPVTVDSNTVQNYTLPDSYESSQKLTKKNSELHILSPFDNLIIQRERLKKLFNFDYALECYVPAPKRQHGYFVLPVLWEDNFIGRIDTKAVRKDKLMQIKSISIEDTNSISDKFFDSFSRKLYKFSKFNNCDKIQIDKIKPAKYKKELNRFIKLYF